MRSNPENISFTSVEQNGSIEIDIKPSVGMLNLGYAACTSAELIGSTDINVKPSLGVSKSISGCISASQDDTEIHAVDS
jgi:hypothetical protein